MVSAQGIWVLFMERRLWSIVREGIREITVWPTSPSETESMPGLPVLV